MARDRWKFAYEGAFIDTNVCSHRGQEGPPVDFTASAM